MTSSNETDHQQSGGKFVAAIRSRLRKQEKPRGRGKKKTKLYFNNRLSKKSIIFLSLALFQAIVMIILMVNIIVLGDYNDELVVDQNGTTYDELSCSEKEDLRHDIGNRNFSGVEEPEGFGEDQLIYVILFMCVAVYSFGLLLYALWFQSILEVTAFVVLNVLMTIYSGVQVYHFRAVDPDNRLLTTAGYFALGNTLFLAMMTIVFIFLFHDTYFEFGWKMYKRIRRSEWRFYYRWYQTLMSLGKLTVLFIIVFELGQCILLLDYCDVEFYFSILIMIVAIAVLIASYFIVRNEKKWLTVGLGITLILLAAYLLFKIIRFATRSCPLCRLRNRLPFSEREQTFGHLIMIASINLILNILTFFVLIVVYHNYDKGLLEQFRQMKTDGKSTNLTRSTTTRISNDDLEETDQPTRPTSSDQFRLQPPEQSVMDHSLQRNVQGFFRRHTEKQPQVQEPESSDGEHEDVETGHGQSFKVTLQSVNGSAVSTDDANNNNTPPISRPQALLFKQNSAEPTQQ